MKNIFFLILMYFSEWIILYTYAKGVYKKRGVFSLPITIILYMALMLTYRYVTSEEVFNILFTLICNILFFNLGFKCTFKSSIFHVIVLLIIQFITEVITIYFIAFVSDSSNTSYLKNDTIYIIDVIISKILFFTISRFLLKLSNRENSTKSWGRWFSLAILPISSLFMIIVTRILTNGQTFSFVQSTLCISAICSLLISNIVIYSIYERAEASNQKLIELELINQKNNIDMQYLALLEKKNEQMQIMSHDYKNNIMTIADMTDSPEIQEYVKDMMGEIKKYNQLAKTKNKLLDVILNKYTDICSTKDIKFETDILTDNLEFIDGYDISSLFNNILDNAVEAASLSEEKYIHLEITNSLNSYHKIIAINSCDIEPKTKNHKLVTTKSNKEVHGFGTKSIHNIIDKYDGEMQWEYDKEKKEFKMIILIPSN